MEEVKKTWTCPKCYWTQTAHPTYGWASHNEHAVEVHKTILCPSLKEN